MSAPVSRPQGQQEIPQNTQRESMSPNVEDLYLESYAFTTAAAIVGSVDRKIFVLLRDGRNLFGILRTFDQFANLVLQDAWERIYLNDTDTNQPTQFGECYRGVFMVRGENVVMMGELDIDKEDDHLDVLQQIPFDQAEGELKKIHGARIAQESQKSKKLLAKGLINDFVKSDMY
jgi:U6 snRNA-associated Sm-like protein LSm1